MLTTHVCFCLLLRNPLSFLSSSGDFAPIAGDMTRQELHPVLSGFFEGGQRARCGDELTEVKQRFSFCLFHEVLLIGIWLPFLRGAA